MSKSNLPPTSPLRDPPGWLSLRQAFAYIGASAIGPGFPLLPRGEMERAMDRAFVGRAELSQDGEPICDDGDLAAVFYFAVGLCLSSAIRSGRIKSAYCEKGGGSPKPMDLGWWQTDHPMLRYQTWCIDPDKPFSGETELPCWVFLNWDDLHSVLEELSAWRNGLPDFRDIEDPVNGVDRTDCYTGRLAVSLVNSPEPGIWFTCPWLPDYERAAAPPPPANDPPPDQPNLELVQNDHEGRAKKVQTKPKPPFYPTLRELFIAADEKEANFKLRGKPPPIFPTAAQFKRVLEARGWSPEMVKSETVRYHIRALKEEFGRQDL